MDPLSSSPIPRDLPLSLPAPAGLLHALIVVLFLAHIVFVNLMVGGALVALVAEAAGRRRRDYDLLAREIAKTITVNKSLAVVLGVGPLLAINVLYTVYFYSANALTGTAWIMVVPLVTLAFLLAYAHKYSWDRMARMKRLHIALGAAPVILFLLIPLIFLTNINLMLFPEKWTQVRGFLSAAKLPNVLPRYAHFLLASVAVTGLFLMAYFTRRGYAVEETFETLSRPAIRRFFYSIALFATFSQLVIGPFVLVTLPRHGLNWLVVTVFIAGAALAIIAMWLMWWEITADDGRIGRLFVPVVAVIMLTGGCMGTGRHLYRESAVADHRVSMARRTEDFRWASAAAEQGAAVGLMGQAGDLPLGERVYRNTCSACHTTDRVFVGPAVREIAEIYKGDPAGIIAWTKAPGKKRAGLPRMPAFAFLSDAELSAVAEHMLQLGAAAGSPAASQPAATSMPAGWECSRAVFRRHVIVLSLCSPRRNRSFGE